METNRFGKEGCIMDRKIILYTSDTCHRCKIVKDFFNIHSVEYEEVKDRERILSMDVQGVPVLEVDGKIIDDWVSVLGWIQQNGYYSFEVDNDESN
jgi:glutaredoxin